MTILPLYSPRLTGVPLVEGAVKSGAGSPTLAAVAPHEGSGPTVEAACPTRMRVPVVVRKWRRLMVSRIGCSPFGFSFDGSRSKVVHGLDEGALAQNLRQDLRIGRGLAIDDVERHAAPPERLEQRGDLGTLAGPVGLQVHDALPGEGIGHRGRMQRDPFIDETRDAPGRGGIDEDRRPLRA